MNTFPAAFEERMKNLLGTEAEAFFEALQTDVPVSIRLNPGKPFPANPLLSRDGQEEISWCKGGYYLKQRPVFTLDPCFHAGAYYVQEASSMFLQHMLQQILPAGPVRALDLCAAPGGKSTLLAAALSADSLLVSNEVIRSRAAILRENIIKWGQDNVVVTRNDPADFAALEEAFDLILVDAPCSGEGMFRKDNKAVEEWSENNLRLCSERQKRILTDIWKCLRPGGVLIYSTCTFNRGENEAIVEWLTEHFAASPISIEHTFNGIIAGDSHCACYRFYPHKIRGEGFFTAAVRKEDGNLCAPRKEKKQKALPSVKLPAELQSMMLRPERYTAYAGQSAVGVVPTLQAGFIQNLGLLLDVIYQGCELAELHNHKLKLMPAFALWQGLKQENCALYPANRETALSFLKKEDIPLQQADNGWVLVSYENLGLGWCKNLGNRLNNYYPKEWRIRMDLH